MVMEACSEGFQDLPELGREVGVLTGLIRPSWPWAGDYICDLSLPMTGLLVNSGHHDALSSTLLSWRTAVQRFL